MTLILIKPSRIGFDPRTFHGVNCDHVDKVVTEAHSMNWMKCENAKKMKNLSEEDPTASKI